MKYLHVLRTIRQKLFDLKHNFSDKLDDKGNIVQPITRPIVPSGGVLKDINNKIEKLQHDSKVIIRRFLLVRVRIKRNKNIYQGILYIQTKSIIAKIR